MFSQVLGICITALWPYSANRGSKVKRLPGVCMLGQRVKPQWQLGMVGPEMNWRVCALLKTSN